MPLSYVSEETGEAQDGLVEAVEGALQRVIDGSRLRIDERQSGPDGSGVKARKEQGSTPAQSGEAIAVSFGDALDEAMQTQPS